MFTVGRVVNHREDQKSVILQCIYLQCTTVTELLAELLILHYFSQQFSSWSQKTEMLDSSYPDSRGLSSASSEVTYIIIREKRNLKIQAPKWQFLAAATPLSHKEVYFSEQHWKGQNARLNWASCQTSKLSHPTWITENYLQPSKQICCSEINK